MDAHSHLQGTARLLGRPARGGDAGLRPGRCLSLVATLVALGLPTTVEHFSNPGPEMCQAGFGLELRGPQCGCARQFADLRARQQQLEREAAATRAQLNDWGEFLNGVGLEQLSLQVSAQQASLRNIAAWIEGDECSEELDRLQADLNQLSGGLQMLHDRLEVFTNEGGATPPGIDPALLTRRVIIQDERGRVLDEDTYPPGAPIILRLVDRRVQIVDAAGRVVSEESYAPDETIILSETPNR